METETPRVLQPGEEPADAAERARLIEIASGAGIDATVIWTAYRRGCGSAAVQRPDLGDLSNAEYRIIRRHISLQILAAKGESPRAHLNGVLYRVRHRRTAWRGLPSKYPHGDNLRQRHIRWLGEIYGLILAGVRSSRQLCPDRQAEFELLGEMVLVDRARIRDRQTGDRPADE